MESIGNKAKCDEESFIVLQETSEISSSSNNHPSHPQSESKNLGQEDGEEKIDDTEVAKKETIMEAASSKALRPFVIISSSYLLFTITDGAIRMIVLLHAYNKSFSALEVSIMFTLYELAGVFTNLVGQEMDGRVFFVDLPPQLLNLTYLFIATGCWIVGSKVGDKIYSHMRIDTATNCV